MRPSYLLRFPTTSSSLNWLTTSDKSVLRCTFFELFGTATLLTLTPVTLTNDRAQQSSDVTRTWSFLPTGFSLDLVVDVHVNTSLSSFVHHILSHPLYNSSCILLLAIFRFHPLQSSAHHTVLSLTCVIQLFTWI